MYEFIKVDMRIYAATQLLQTVATYWHFPTALIKRL